MTDTIRARIEAALQPHVHNGHLVDAELDDVVNAVMPVAEAAMHRAHHDYEFPCPWCPNCARPSCEPHRMDCPFFAGPVTHEIRSAASALEGTAVEVQCTCGVGRTWTGRITPCPNAAEVWRGPLLAREDVR